VGAALGLLHPVTWGRALKLTKFPKLYEYFKYFFFNISGNFWVPTHSLKDMNVMAIEAKG
jgi:hypothetical protein